MPELMTGIAEFQNSTSRWPPNHRYEACRVSKVKTVRLENIDAARFLGAFAVVLIHATDYAGNAGTNLNINHIINQIARFSVPFFLVASGYVFGLKRSAGKESLVRSLGRLAWLFVFWAGFYVLLTRQGVLSVSWDQISALLNPSYVAVMLVTGGPGYHLWFLPTLGLCLTLTFAMDVFGISSKRMLAIGAALYILGLLLGSYGGAFIKPHLNHWTLQQTINGRNGPFALIFVVAGFVLARDQIRISMRLSCMLFGLGGFLHLAEAYALSELNLSPFPKNDFLAGTVPFGIGAFLVGLNWRPERAAGRLFARLGRMSLGIYVLHVIFVIALTPYLTPIGLAAPCLVAVMAFLISTLIAFMLRSLPLVRPLVS